jgi:hypothetical protein
MHMHMEMHMPPRFVIPAIGFAPRATRRAPAGRVLVIERQKGEVMRLSDGADVEKRRFQRLRTQKTPGVRAARRFAF